MDMTVTTDIERHPWEPFIPPRTKVLMLGSFPPKKERWSMDFFYPNFNNDMWRIIGAIFFGDKEYFIDRGGTDRDGSIRGKAASGRLKPRFDRDRITAFCNSAGLALYDTALEVRRLADNASDKFLEVVTPVDIRAMLDRMPECTAIISTGEKASGIIAAEFGCPIPKVGSYMELPDFRPAHRPGHDEEATAGNTPAIRFYRLPSSSRAYPLALDRKIQAYSVLKGLLLPAE